MKTIGTTRDSTICVQALGADRMSNPRATALSIVDGGGMTLASVILTVDQVRELCAACDAALADHGVMRGDASKGVG